jgi:hypothetical protein
MAINGQLRYFNALLSRQTIKHGLLPLVQSTFSGDVNPAESDMFNKAFWGNYTPLPLDMAFYGGDPIFRQKFDKAATLLDLQLIGGDPVLESTPYGTVTAGSFAVADPIILGAPVNTGVVTAGSFRVDASIFGGGIVTGGMFAADVVITGTAAFYGSVTARGFRAEPNIVSTGSYTGVVLGRGFKVDASILGGGSVTARSFKVTPVIIGTAPPLGVIQGSGFATAVRISATVPVFGTVTGGSFLAGLAYGRITARGFAVEPRISSTFNAAYAEAYVMNVLTNEVSRYDTFPFMHVARIGGVNYCIGADGFYSLSGQVTTGSITTKETDFGDFHSKNVPFIYTDTDEVFDITTIVDGAEAHTYTAQFGGRKQKLGRGNKGRYWAFRLDGITKLQGLEYLPEVITRRVK